MMRYRLLILLFLFAFFAFGSAFGQDTESKDDPSYIMVYIRLQVEASPCRSCYDSLTAKVKRIPGAQAVKTDIIQSVLQFKLHALLLVSDKELMRLAEDSNLYPLNIEFNKEPPELEEEPVSF